jgi:superoxide dismutase, Fe-Mn family
MAYEVKPLACDSTRIKGLSEKLIVSHYENNYGGAVRRLNAITEQPTVHDVYARAWQGGTSGAGNRPSRGPG